MKKLVYHIIALFLAAIPLQGQLITVEELQEQMQTPTMGYFQVVEEADLLFDSSSGTISSEEKEYERWKYVAGGRSTFPGASASSTLKDLGNYLGVANASSFFCGSGPQESGWTSVGPNPNANMVQAIGLLSCIEVHPTNEDIIYVGTEHAGLWKTTDGGSNWANVIDNSGVSGIPGLGISAISINPNNTQEVVVGTHTRSFKYPDWQQSSTGYGILRTTDGGATWSTTNSTGANDDYWHIKVIKRHPTNSSVILAAGNKRIWKSSDAGVNWTVVFDNPTSKGAYFIDIEFSLSTPSTVFASNKLFGWGGSSAQNQQTPASPHASQVFVSTLGGNTGSWTEVTPPNAQSATSWAKNIVMDVTPADPIFLYTLHAKGNNHYIYKTSNAGQTWTLVTSSSNGSLTNNNWGFYRHEFEISDNSTSVMYAGTNTLVKSIDGGNTWTSKSQYFPQPPAATSTHADIRGIANLGFKNGEDVLVMVNDGGIAKTASSANSKTSWNNLNGNGLVVTEFFGMDAFRSTNKIVGGAIHNGTFLFDGLTWTPFVQLGDGDWNEIDHKSIEEQRCYSIVNGRIYKSDNQGSSYSLIPGQPEIKFQLNQRLHISPVNNNRIYYAFKNAHYYDVSSQNWTTIFTKEQSDPTNSTASIIKVAASDENVVYLAFKDVTWDNSNHEYKFYKTTDGGTNWTNITTNLSGTHGKIYNWSYVGDLVIDPANSNRVFVGIKNYGRDANNPTLGTDRVLRSEDGGISWTDISTGLPSVPVNYLNYVEGSSDLIFAGTDAGVYYFDASSSEWICFNRDLPNAIVTKVEVDPCNEKVYASTLGRGVWEAPMPDIQRTLSVSTSENWSGNKMFNGEIIIPQGTTLTITGTLQMGRKGRIFIKPGGKLIIDGGHITSGNCSDWWGGISVEGNSNQPQHSSHQGFLEIINGGTISHARDAISNVSPGSGDDWYDWSTRGGMIEATGAHFLNNRRDVALISYISPNANAKYHAVFKNCTFERNNDFDIEAMLASISMWDVSGIIIEGCTFINNNTEQFAYEGEGIFTADATYRVHEYGTTGCSFTGYADAIRSLGNNSVAFPITIVGATFTDNIHSIYLNSVQNAKVAYNDISVQAGSGHTLPPGSQSAPYGIYMDCSSIFQLHDNDLEKSGSDDQAIGIVINETGGSADHMYHNIIDGFDYGIQGLGNNQDSKDKAIGLHFMCNDLGTTTHNTADILVAGSIASVQGKDGDLPNNRFTPSTSGSSFQNIGSTVIYPHGQGEPRTVPGNSGTGFYTGLALDPKSIFVNFSTDCPADPKPPIANPGTVTQDLANIEYQLGQDRELREQLIDEGSTPALEAQILFAEDQSDYQDLYIDMMDIAPYVSVDNLLNVANLDDFPELALRNIMVANPHGARDDEVWDALISHEPPLSQQTLDDIENETQTITAKDVLDMRIGIDQMHSENLVAKLLEYYSNEMLQGTGDHITDIRNLLKGRDEPHFRYALVDAYLHEGNISTANAELTAMASECVMGETEQQAYSSMQDFYAVVTAALGEGEGRLDQLDAGAISSLMQIEETGTGPAVFRARNLLQLNGQETGYIEPVYLDGGISQKRAIASETERPRKPEAAFKLWPNPADDYSVLQWNWFEAGLTAGFDIEIYNMDGTLVHSIRVPDHQVNTKVLRTESLKPGAYILHIRQEKRTLENLKLVIE